MKKDWNKKVDEKDYVKLAVIVGVLVLGYFVYVNFVPKTFDDSLMIDIVEIDVECPECVDISGLTAKLAQLGVEVGDHDIFEYDSVDGRKMIEKYGIERVPALIIVSKEFDEDSIKGAFDLYDGYSVFKMNVPYLDVNSGEVKGLVSITEVSPDCENCYPLTSLKDQFEQLGVRFNGYEIVLAESKEGSDLIDKYDLEFAPALLISKNIDEYSWVMSDIGNALEDRGEYYLFSTPVTPYKDLLSGETKGGVKVTLINDSSCADCFDIYGLKQLFQKMGVFFTSEEVLDISSFAGKSFAKKYNVTKVPTVVLSKEILDYPQFMDALSEVGSFDEVDQSFVFRKLDLVGKFKEVSL
jgi:hypothetical protein